jgi:hypothetical protein
LNGHRDWVRDRRARTRLLIEYGGLLMKAGLPEQVEDDRATLLGALLMIRDQLEGLGGDSPADLKARWRRQGLRAFDADAAAKTAASQSAPDKVGEPMPSGRVTKQRCWRRQRLGANRFDRQVEPDCGATISRVLPAPTTRSTRRRDAREHPCRLEYSNPACG